MATISTAERLRAIPRVRARRRAGWLAAGIVCLGGAAALGLFVGPVHLAPVDVLRKLLSVLPFVHDTSHLSASEQAILMQLRLPRVVLAALVGATLSVSGAAYQGAFRNPLADPYLLGAAAGAGLGATLAIAYTHAGVGSNLSPVAAFIGALAAVALAYAMGRAGGGRRTATTLVLAGIAVMSFFTAIQTYLQQRKSETLREVYGWVLGRLATVGWHDVLLILPYIVVGMAVIFAHRRLLDVLALGDEEADTLGIDTRRVRLTVVIAASLATAAAVAVSGLIGFVGIIVPHIIRLVAGTSYRVILPLCITFGAAFLILADLLGRTLISPAELPIGVVTAFVGAPFFAFVLRSSRKMS
ncbi:MAG: FecCD family ABC transporter permease [Actinomycetota bacterium]